MARHASPKSPTARRVLVLLATAGATLGAGAAAASADSAPVLGVMRTRPVSLDQAQAQGLPELTGVVGRVTGPLADLRPNPLAGTGVDPLDNGLATRIGDFKPLGTQSLTRPVAEAQSLGSVPVVGQVLRGTH
ncbi:hypothetical protein ACIHAA_20065 [Streptomyces sp. NPDC052040]|uniref:hypothetical protein n=1 Tax=unclassified Streptomyces TaxID=2593676 RepID=UPI0037D63132